MPVPIAIALGGALGSWLRYVIATEVTDRAGVIGAGTFAVNVLGAFLLGLVFGLVEARFPDTPRWVGSGISLGVMGGFTTFSAFSLDFAVLWERGALASALGYALASMIGSILALFLGLWLARSFA